MARFSLYRLYFKSPLHLGDERTDYSISLKTIHSDSFYAALTSCLAIYNHQIPEDGDLGFTISSLFPFYQADPIAKPVLFFPKSLIQPAISPKFSDQYKTIKKVRWLDWYYFKRQLAGEVLIDKPIDMERISGEYLSEIPVRTNFIRGQNRQRVVVERSGEKPATPFYMELISFADYSGLFFLAQGDTSVLESGLEYLQNEGIGTDRNVGYGLFSFEKDEFEIDLPESDFQINLSLFCPDQEITLQKMMSGPDCAYDLVRRGGWITTAPHIGFRKKSIYAFREGSVFESAYSNSATIQGKIVDLRPNIDFNPVDHPVWRNLKSIFLPIKLNAQI